MARARRAALYTELSRCNKQRNPSLRAERKSNCQCSSARWILALPGGDLVRPTIREPKYQVYARTNAVLWLQCTSRAHKSCPQVIDSKANCEGTRQVAFNPCSYGPGKT